MLVSFLNIESIVSSTSSNIQIKYLLFPGLDLFRLFIYRIVNKKNPFIADTNHLHHLLLKKYNATKTAFTASELAFNNTKTRFDLGVVNSFEFNDSKNKLNLAKSNLNQAKFDYIFKVKILDFYQGKPITL